MSEKETGANGAQGTAVVTVSAGRFPWLPAIEERYGVSKAQWRALTDAIFPRAKTLDSIILALSYCEARKLDIFKRPVHIVPMWSTELNCYVDTIWPGIGELRTTASRTKGYAGRDATIWGPDVTVQYGEYKVTHPEWAEVVVRRLIGPHIAAFHGPRVYWSENYSPEKFRKPEPNEMWRKRPRGQLEKCFAPDTEVLTDVGFERFDSARGRILQVTAAGLEVTTAKPFVQHYSGRMLTADGDALNFSVTPNHDMVLVDGDKIEASALFEKAKSNGDMRIPLSITGAGVGSGVHEARLRMAAAIVCDGWRSNDSSWSVAVSRPRKVAALTRLAMHKASHIREVNGDTSVLAGRQITSRLPKTVFVFEACPDVVTDEKLFPREMLLSLNSDEAGALLDALLAGDGSVTPNGTRRFYSSNPKLLGQVELIAIIAGYAVSKRTTRESPGARPNQYITISRKRSVAVLSTAGRLTVRSGHRNVVRETEHSGPVWCARVPSGLIVVRRNGLSMVCGNCAEAAALRQAFPEEIGNEYTADEMEGKVIEGRFEAVPSAPPAPAATQQPSVNRLDAFAGKSDAPEEPEEPSHENAAPPEPDEAVNRAALAAILERIKSARTKKALASARNDAIPLMGKFDEVWPEGKEQITDALAFAAQAIEGGD